MTVQEIKERHARRAELEETALLRAVAPAAKRNQANRRRRERKWARVNERLARCGVPLRVLP